MPRPQADKRAPDGYRAVDHLFRHRHGLPAYAWILACESSLGPLSLAEMIRDNGNRDKPAPLEMSLDLPDIVGSNVPAANQFHPIDLFDGTYPVKKFLQGEVPSVMGAVAVTTASHIA